MFLTCKGNQVMLAQATVRCRLDSPILATLLLTLCEPSLLSLSPIQALINYVAIGQVN